MSDLPWVRPAFQQFLEEVRLNRLAHALLVQGEQGIGIELLSDDIVYSRVCQQLVDGACHDCKSCHLMKAMTHPDFFDIAPSGAGEVIKVDQIREAVEFLSQTPQISAWKVVRIQDAHRLNTNAANALLKVLEEPPGNSLLVLVTDRPQLLIPTVRSRCRKLIVANPNGQEAKQYCLQNDVGEEQFNTLRTVLGLRPLRICDWVREGYLSQWQSLSTGLEKLVNSQITARDLTESLGEQKLPELLEWLLILASKETKKASLPIADRSNSSKSMAASWVAMYDWLASARQDVERGTNPNRQLLLDECFLRWKSATVRS